MRQAFCAFMVLFVSAAAGSSLSVRIEAVAGNFAVGLVHKLLQLVLKADICGRSVCHGLSGTAELRTGRSAVCCGTRLSGFRLQSSLYGQIYLSAFTFAEYFNTYCLTHFQMVIHVIDICVGYFRNVYKAAAAVRK